MQGSGDSTTLMRLAETRVVCQRDIHIQQQKIDSTQDTLRRAFITAISEADHTIHLQEKLEKLKGKLREAEDALVKSLSVKTQKEAKRMAMLESISDVKIRVQELKGLLKDQRERKETYADIVAQHCKALTACKVLCDQDREHGEQIQEAVSWYNRILGFSVECGHGVKFMFTNISPENQNKEYSFVVRHANDSYALLNCNPYLSDTQELVLKLNTNNGLFEFVRTMREKFQEAATGSSLHSSSPDQGSSIISLSTPVASFSTDSNSRKMSKQHTVQSAGSASSLRRSSRLKSKK